MGDTDVVLERRIGPGSAAVVLAAVLYAVILGWFSVAAHRGFLTQMNDLGNADQAIWAASRGDLRMTVSNDVDGVVKSRLAVHLNVLYLALAPLYLVARSPVFLLLLGVASVALASLGIHAWARRHLGDGWTAALFPLAFLLHPMVHDATLFDFKIVTLATAALVWSIVAFESGHPVAGWVLAIVVLLSQEDLALLTLFLAVWLAANGRRKGGAALAAVTVLYLAVMLGVVVPLLSAGDGLAKLTGVGNRLAWLGSGAGEIAGAIASRPLEVAAHLLRPDRLRLPLYLLLSGGVAALAAPRLLVLLVPTTIGAMLTGTPWMTQITGTYYHLPSVAIVMMAAAEATARLRTRRGARLAATNAAYAPVAALAFSLLLSPLPHSAVSSWAHYPNRSRELEAFRTIASAIPANASVTAQNNVAAHLAHRSRIAAFPRGIGADFALFHLRCPPGADRGLFVRTHARALLQLTPQTLARNVGAMLASPDWRLVGRAEGFYLFRRERSRGAESEAQRALAVDVERFRRECEASRAPLGARRLLVGAYGWADLPAVIGAAAGGR